MSISPILLMQTATHAAEPRTADPVTLALTGALPLVLLLAVLIALPVSFKLIKRYRRAVSKSMKTPASQAAAATAHDAATPAPPYQHPVQTTLDVAVIDQSSHIPTEPEAEALYTDLVNAPRRAATIYAVAGACYALVMALCYVAAINSASPLSILFQFSIHAWPIVLTVNLVAAATRRKKLLTVLVYFLVYAVVGVIALVGSGITPSQIVLAWLAGNLVPTLILLTFLNRRVRAVGPLVLIFMFLATLGAQLALVALSLAIYSEGTLRSVIQDGVNSWFGPYLTFFGIAAAGFIIVWPAGWLTLRWIRSRYERKKINDQSITLDSVWLMFGVFSSIVLAFEGVWWVFSGLAAFAAYKVVALAGFSLFGRKTSRSRKPPKLLLLRVFSLEKQSANLFGALEKHWRHVGSIQLIAGADLATSTLEPHEFLDFLSRKLARRFIDGDETLNRKMSEMDLEPDGDGRFRVNDFFCHADTWKPVLTRLVSDSDAVLMDLRSFSEKKKGCIHEINELINIAPLEKVDIIVDDTTDEKFLRAQLKKSWEQMPPTSPNRLSASKQIRLFRFTGEHGGELQQLLRALSVAASPA